MRISTFSYALSLMALAACSSQTEEQEAANAALDLSEGSVSISAPGFNMALDIPPGVARNVDIDSDSNVVFPGSKVGAIRLNSDPAKGSDQLEIDFASERPIEEIASWYADPARAEAFRVTEAAERDGVRAIRGTDESGQAFDLVLKEREGGGTLGRLKFRD